MHIFASWPYLGLGSANFRKAGQTRAYAVTANSTDMRPASTSKSPQSEEGEEEEEEEGPEFDSSGDEIPYVKRSRCR